MTKELRVIQITTPEIVPQQGSTGFALGTPPYLWSAETGRLRATVLHGEAGFVPPQPVLHVDELFPPVLFVVPSRVVPFVFSADEVVVPQPTPIYDDASAAPMFWVRARPDLSTPPPDEIFAPQPGAGPAGGIPPYLWMMQDGKSDVWVLAGDQTWVPTITVDEITPPTLFVPRPVRALDVAQVQDEVFPFAALVENAVFEPPFVVRPVRVVEVPPATDELVSLAMDEGTYDVWLVVPPVLGLMEAEFAQYWIRRRRGRRLHADGHPKEWNAT